MNPKNNRNVKRLFLASVSFVAALMFLPAGGNGQTPQRIQFAKGKSSATVRGTTGQNGTSFLVRARSGQNLILTLGPSANIGVKVEKDGRYGHSVLLREERGGTYEIGLEESGDYTIFIGSKDGRSRAFTLSVQVTHMTDI